MRRKFAFWILLALALTACAARVDLTILNSGLMEICELYFWPEEDRWQKVMFNRLYGPMQPGDTVVVADQAPGTYSLQALPCDPDANAFTLLDFEITEDIRIIIGK